MKAAQTIAVESGSDTLYLDISKIDGYRVNYERTSIDVFLNGQVIHIDTDSLYEVSKFIESIMEE